MAKRPRNSAKALIVKDGCLLLIRILREGDLWYLLPGGGQKHNETLTEALEREVKEETGAKVKAGNLLFIREYRSERHEFRKRGEDFHQVEFFFEAKLKKGSKVGVGIKPDRGQIAIDWVPLNEIPKVNLYPRSLRKLFAGKKSKTFYHGDVN